MDVREDGLGVKLGPPKNGFTLVDGVDMRRHTYHALVELQAESLLVYGLLRLGLALPSRAGTQNPLACGELTILSSAHINALSHCLTDTHPPASHCLLRSFESPLYFNNQGAVVRVATLRLKGLPLPEDHVEPPKSVIQEFPMTTQSLIVTRTLANSVNTNS